MSIKLDEINVMNIEDMDYYDSCYEISILISNAINPIFEVYANNAGMSLEILVEKLVESNSINIISVEIEIEDFEEIKDSCYNIDGYWIDLDYIDIKEVY